MSGQPEGEPHQVDDELNSPWIIFTLIIAVVVLIILFAGEPDLHDILLNKLQN